QDRRVVQQVARLLERPEPQHEPRLLHRVLPWRALVLEPVPRLRESTPAECPLRQNPAVVIPLPRRTNPHRLRRLRQLRLIPRERPRVLPRIRQPLAVPVLDLAVLRLTRRNEGRRANIKRQRHEPQPIATARPRAAGSSPPPRPSTDPAAQDAS